MIWYGAAMAGALDNGPRLPLWDQLPRAVHWLLPAVVGVPLTVLALRRNGVWPTER